MHRYSPVALARAGLVIDGVGLVESGDPEIELRGGPYTIALARPRMSHIVESTVFDDSRQSSHENISLLVNSILTPGPGVDPEFNLQGRWRHPRR